ncbi:hypothetical protein GINT2_000428 [Glugoides intestinalis]
MVLILNKDPEADYLLVRVVGGETPGASFSQRVGPLKIPGKVVGEDIKKLTAKEFKLQKVHVLLKVKDRKATCELLPSTAQVIIRELKETREAKKKGVEKAPQLHNGSLSLNSLFKVAAEIRARSRSKTMKGTLKEAIGTARSVGCTIEGKHPKDVTEAVNKGKEAVAELFGIDNADSLPAFLDD